MRFWRGHVVCALHRTQLTRSNSYGQELSLAQKVYRLGVRLRDPEWRRFGAILLTGKLTAVGLLLLVALLVNPGQLGLSTFAADPRA